MLKPIFFPPLFSRTTPISLPLYIQARAYQKCFVTHSNVRTMELQLSGSHSLTAGQSKPFLFFYVLCSPLLPDP